LPQLQESFSGWSSESLGLLGLAFAFPYGHVSRVKSDQMLPRSRTEEDEGMIVWGREIVEAHDIR
jgi:hypothetical protein